MPQSRPKGTQPKRTVAPQQPKKNSGELLRPEPASPDWGLGDAVIGLILGLALTAVFEQIVVLCWPRLYRIKHVVVSLRPRVVASKEVIQSVTPGENLTIIALGLIGLWIGLAGSTWFASKRKGTGSLATDFGFSWQIITDAPIGIALGVAFQLAIVPVLYFPLRHAIPNLTKSLDQPADNLFKGYHGYELAILAVLVSVGSPIVEELFFRGLLLRSLEKKLIPGLGTAWGAAVSVGISAVVFGLAHAETLQLLGLVALGIVLAMIARRIRRLGLGMFIHASFNATAVVLVARGH